MRTPGTDLRQHVNYIFHLSSALGGLQHHVSDREGMVYRGIDVLLSRETYDVNKQITWQAFSSSTKKQQKVLDFVRMMPGRRLGGSIFVIKSTTAKDIRHFSAFTSEEEVLFPPNSQFKVVSVVTEEDEKKRLLDQLSAYDLSDLDVYELVQLG